MACCKVAITQFWMIDKRMDWYHRFIDIHHVCIWIHHVIIRIVICILRLTVNYVYPFRISFAFNLYLFEFISRICKTNKSIIIIRIIFMTNIWLPYLISQDGYIWELFLCKTILYISQTSAFCLLDSEIFVFEKSHNMNIFFLIKQIFKIRTVNFSEWSVHACRQYLWLNSRRLFLFALWLIHRSWSWSVFQSV